MTTTYTIRQPDTRSTVAMTRRAWWLVWLNILIPGSAQMLAGNRRFGRFAVSATLSLWAAGIVALLLYLFARPVAYSLITTGPVLWFIEIVLGLYAALWVILTIDTVRLTRLVRVNPAARLAVALFSVVALVLSVGLASYGAVVTNSARQLLSDVFSGGQVTPPINGRYNILLLGGDAGPDRIGLRPDSISVVSIDAATGSATIIGVPRNLEHIPFVAGSPLYRPYPNGYDCGLDCLISYLYTYGEANPQLYPDAVAKGSEPGIEAERDAVEGVTGLTLQYYVLIDMQGFSDLIDALGGVTIDVPSAIPLGKNGSPQIGTIAAGVQKMNGATALWYARSRYNMTDYDRMARQRQVQEAILAQFQPSNVLTKFQAVAKAGAQVVKTDIPASMLGYFVDLASKTRSLPVTTLELVPAYGVDTVRPDIAAIQAKIAASLLSPSPTPSVGGN